MELRMVYFWLHALAVGGRCVCGSIFSSYIHSRVKKDKPTVFVPLSKCLIQVKSYFMSGVASWMLYVCSCIVVLWYI